MTKPSPPKLLNSIEELVKQDEIGYFIEIGARNENLGKDSPPGSTLKSVLVIPRDDTMRYPDSHFRLFHENRERFPGTCAANAGKIKEGYACLGEGLTMMKMISDDFGRTAECNYHMTTSHISNLPYALAFRVGITALGTVNILASSCDSQLQCN